MTQSCQLPKVGRFMLPLGAGVLAVLVLLSGVPVQSAQNPPPPKNSEALSPATTVNNQAAKNTPIQTEGPKKSNLEKTKSDAAELSALADQLRDELDKMNVNVFSLDVLHKTEMVEKLAKKIKVEANGH
jgi:hypothetical protein